MQRWLVMLISVCVMFRLSRLGLFQVAGVQGKVCNPVYHVARTDGLRLSRTFRELDIMFEQKVPARKFKQTVVALDTDAQEQREE
jgi:hypothetical protein